MSFRNILKIIVNIKIRFAGIAAALLIGGAFLYQPAFAEGDPERGEALGYTCLGCHGIADYKNVYPTYHVPRLGGQHPEYIVAALEAYKAGDRDHDTMHAQAASLSEQDMQDIAAYLAGLSVGVPGTPAIMEAIHDDHGGKAWPSLFRDAHRLARDGFALTERTSSQAFSAGRRPSPIACTRRCSSATACLPQAVCE